MKWHIGTWRRVEIRLHFFSILALQQKRANCKFWSSPFCCSTIIIFFSLFCPLLSLSLSLSLYLNIPVCLPIWIYILYRCSYNKRSRSCYQYLHYSFYWTFVLIALISTNRLRIFNLLVEWEKEGSWTPSRMVILLIRERISFIFLLFNFNISSAHSIAVPQNKRIVYRFYFTMSRYGTFYSSLHLVINPLCHYIVLPHS